MIANIKIVNYMFLYFIVCTLLGPNIDESLLRGPDFAKDIGTAMASMSGSFDSDLFPSAEEAMRAGLDPIDFDGLQILPDIDATNEDAFKLERS